MEPPQVNAEASSSTAMVTGESEKIVYAKRVTGRKSKKPKKPKDKASGEASSSRPHPRANIASDATRKEVFRPVLDNPLTIEWYVY